MKKLIFVFALLVLFSGCYAPAPTGYNSLPWSDISRERPAIMVGGEIYCYDDDFITKYIPENYTEVGRFVPVPDELPDEELEMRCKKSFSGRVFAGDKTNTTVYVIFDGEDEKYCLRFVHEKMTDGSVGHNGFISYGGKLYLLPSAGYDGNLFEELPEGFVSAGKLHYIGVDNLPQKDLETNLKYHSGSDHTDGNEIFADPDDQSAVYAHFTRYTKEGPVVLYLKCELIEE